MCFVCVRVLLVARCVLRCFSAGWFALVCNIDGDDDDADEATCDLCIFVYSRVHACEHLRDAPGKHMHVTRACFHVEIPSHIYMCFKLDRCAHERI